MRAALLGVVAACSGNRGGPPTGFSGASDTHWELPLVGPLEDGLLVTPVTINGRGPYLFALDPDARVSVIDGQVAKEGQVAVAKGPSTFDEAGNVQTPANGDIFQIELGSLIVESRTVVVVKANAFDAGGRRIVGLLGRDILTDGLVFSYDRDRGVATLTAQKVWKPPAGAITLTYEDGAPVPAMSAGVRPRRVAKAQIGGETFAMHLDLGAVASQLREPQWDRAKLVTREVEGGFGAIDEVATVRRETRASEPAAVVLGGATNPRVAFIPYEDKRAGDAVDGTLGLGFFAPYDVSVAWDKKTIYLTPRGAESLAKRIARWDTGPLEHCAHPACVQIRIVDPLDGKPPEEGKVHPGVVLSITRDERAGGMDLEVVLEVAGKPELPRLIVNLPPNADRLIDHLGPEFVGATLTVVDASPYPRRCPAKNAGCVDQLAR